LQVEKTRYGKVMWNWWASVVLMLSRAGSVSPDSIYDFQCLGGGWRNILWSGRPWCVIPVMVRR